MLYHKSPPFPLIFAVVIVLAALANVCGAASLDHDEHKGECPMLAPGTVGICLQGCSNDSDCAAREKCCSNGCGLTCQTAIHKKGKPPVSDVITDTDGCTWSSWSLCESCSITQQRRRIPQTTNNDITNSNDNSNNNNNNNDNDSNNMDEDEDNNEESEEDYEDDESDDTDEYDEENDNENNNNNDNEENYDEDDPENEEDNDNSNDKKKKRDVVVCPESREERYCSRNCTRPASYWKINHYNSKEKDHNRSWPSLNGNLAENSRFPCPRAHGLPWIGIIKLSTHDIDFDNTMTTTANTNNNNNNNNTENSTEYNQRLWNALAKQYITARMNERAGAHVPDYVDNDLKLSRELLHCDNVDVKDDVELAKKLFFELETWNSGKTAVPDCRILCTIPDQMATDEANRMVGVDSLDKSQVPPAPSKTGTDGKFSQNTLIIFISTIVIVFIVVIVGVTAGIIKRRKNRIIFEQEGSFSQQQELQQQGEIQKKPKKSGDALAPLLKQEKQKIQHQDDLEDIELGEEQGEAEGDQGETGIKQIHQREDSEGDEEDEALHL